MYEIFEKLLNERGITAYRFCKDTGVSSSTISTWKKKNSKCNTELAETIANYFDVTIDYVLTGKRESEDYLTRKDDRDIKKKLDSIMKDIRDANDGPLYYNGEEVDETDLSLLENAIESAMKQLKIVNKKKYNPYKNKKK